MLTMTNSLVIDQITVYQDDTNEIDAVLRSIDDRPRPVADVDEDGNPIVVMRSPHKGIAAQQQQRRRFYVLPETPSIAKDEHGKPIFSMIVYRQDEARIDPATATQDVGGGILTFTVELAVPDATFDAIRKKLRTMVFGDDADADQEVDLAYVPFLEGKVSVAVAGEAGVVDDEFVKSTIGTGKISGVGANRRAVMVKLTQKGAALISQIDKLKTLPINVQFELSFEHRLLGVTMRVWCDVASSYHLMQEVTHETDEFDDGYLGLSSNHVAVDKVTKVTETLVRNKTAGVTVIPSSSEVDSETVASLEKSGIDMLNKQMGQMLEAAPPPAELDRAYLEKYFSDFSNSFNFSLDRRMVLVRSFTPSANVANVFREGDIDELIAFIDLRTAFFTFLKVPIRINADFKLLPIDSVTVTVTYERKRFDGSGREQRVDSFDFTSGSAIQTFLAFANSLVDVAYDWSATVHYKGSAESYTLQRKGVKDAFLVIDVGQLGMLHVDVGLGLVDHQKFPGAKASLRYHSATLGRTLEQDFVLSEENESALWDAVIHEEPTGGFEYKVDWLRADGTILGGHWEGSTSSRLRFDAPTTDRLEVAIACTGNFKDVSDEQISQVGVSLRYRDPAHDYEVDGHFVFTDDKQQQTWAVDLQDPALRSYEYKYSIVYKDGLVKSFPAKDGEWLEGEPGFITVGEKYTLAVQLFPTLLTFPDHAKVVEVDLSYDDDKNAIHRDDSFVFSKDAATPRTWRVRGVEGGPRTYAYDIKYYAADGHVQKMPEVVQDSEALVIPPAPAPVATPGP
jgi:hypothetical protein